MAMRVTRTRVSDNEISSEIDILDGVNVDAETRRAIKADVAEFLVDSILGDVSEARSPVTGRGFAPLSADYRRFKQQAGRGTSPNLEFSGDMLDQLGDEGAGRNSIRIGVFGDTAQQADGHNNFSGKSSLPTRRFLPERGQNFTKEIRDGVDSIISDHVVRSRRIPQTRLRAVGSRTALNRLIRELFPAITLNQAKDAILADDDLTSLFEAANLLRFF